MPRRLSTAATLLSLALSAPALASSDDVTPEQVGAIQYDEQKAMDKVDQAHGGKSPVEMSPDERREVMAEKQSALQQVTEKHGVELKDYVGRSSRLSRDDQARVEATKQSLKAKEEADKKAAEEKAAADAKKQQEEERPIIIRKGLGEEQPVDLSDEDELDQVVDGEDGAPAEGDAASSVAQEKPAPKATHAKKAGAGKTGTKSKRKAKTE